MTEGKFDTDSRTGEQNARQVRVVRKVRGTPAGPHAESIEDWCDMVSRERDDVR
jgi:hypothetical protein